jgi:hypothetical protein
MGKNIAAGFAGVVVAGLIVWLVEMLGHTVYPVPPELDMSDLDTLREYIAGLPTGAFAFVAAGWFLGTLGGVLTACRIGTASPMVFTMVVTGLMLFATAYNLVVIPHPLWFSITGVAGILVAAWLGLMLSTKKSANSE